MFKPYYQNGRRTVNRKRLFNLVHPMEDSYKDGEPKSEEVSPEENERLLSILADRKYEKRIGDD